MVKVRRFQADQLKAGWHSVKDRAVFSTCTYDPPSAIAHQAGVMEVNTQGVGSAGGAAVLSQSSLENHPMPNLAQRAGYQHTVLKHRQPGGCLIWIQVQP